ncbi:MAG: helix-turn-helix transcriptional regulator [Anaerolineaceae bacterium]|nr:helix-turn-helix transcriptional regulator [Anaerolineaceae bacterium]
MPRRRRGWAMNGHHSEHHSQHTPLTISLLEPTLLLLISQKERHGYTLLNDLEQMNMGTIHPSVVYRTLRELEGLEWIQSAWDTFETQGPPRRTYTITDLGIQALINWKQQLELHQKSIAQLLFLFKSNHSE